MKPQNGQLKTFFIHVLTSKGSMLYVVIMSFLMGVDNDMYFSRKAVRVVQTFKQYN